MIFQNPLAWLGLAALVVPIVVHLLARRPARHEPFPTIRFLPAATMKPVRRGRPSDWPLLVVRAGIVTAAVAALTQPLWLSDSRERALGQQIARAVIVDISRSMERQTAGGERGVDVARREALRIAAESTHTRIEETTTPASLIDGGVNWLLTQPIRRELVIISDFQTAAVTAADLERVPADVGRKFVPIGVSGAVATGAAGPGGETSTIRLLTSDAETRDAEAARAAAVATGAPAVTRRDRPVVVMFESFPERESWLRSARPLRAPWMFEVAAGVDSDPLVRGAIERIDRRPDDAMRFLTGSIDGTDSLVIVLGREHAPHTLLAAATVGAVLRALADAPSAAELESATRAASELTTLERDPPAVGSNGRAIPGDESDGHWLWAAALLLLIVETVMRRAPRKPAEVEAPHARVA